MSKLNLTELSELHATRRMWMRGRHRENLCGHCRMVYPCPTRQLLDLLTRTMRALRGAGRDACLRFYDCPHDVCIWRRSVLEEYQRAGGTMK